MEALSDPWLWFAAMAAGVYLAAMVIIVFGVVAVFRATLRYRSMLCTVLGILAASCGAGAGIAMNAALAARYIIIPLIAGVLLLVAEVLVRPDRSEWR